MTTETMPRTAPLEPDTAAGRRMLRLLATEASILDMSGVGESLAAIEHEASAAERDLYSRVIPQPAPRYRFRPRNDRYTAPRFRAPMTPRVVEQPWERFPENEPRDLDWRELRDGGLGLRAVVVFVLLCLVILAISIVGWAP